MSNQEANAKSLNAFARIYKSRGIKGIWLHILNLWFDFIRGIDTVERYKSAGVYKSYVTTAQSAIKKSIENAINFLNRDKNYIQFNFIELGAGKGKVIVILKEIILNKFNKIVNILAIEIDKDLCSIFRRNLILSRFSESSNKDLIIKQSRNSKVKIKVDLLNEDIQSMKSRIKIREIIKSGPTIFYCCDSQTKESIINLVQQIIKDKDKFIDQETLFIYSNPRYLDELIAMFRNKVMLITQERGSPQKAYAVLNIL